MIVLEWLLLRLAVAVVFCARFSMVTTSSSLVYWFCSGCSCFLFGFRGFFIGVLVISAVIVVAFLFIVFAVFAVVFLFLSLSFSLFLSLYIYIYIYRLCVCIYVSASIFARVCLTLNRHNHSHILTRTHAFSEVLGG
jgi:hypothetical protein